MIDSQKAGLQVSSDGATAERIAAAFVAARKAGRGLADFPGAAPATLDEAYAIQEAAIIGFGDIGGWKVGRIWPPLSITFGSDRLAGPIFAASIQAVDGSGVRVGHVYADGFRAAEAEFLLRIGRDSQPGTSYSLAEAADMVDAVHVGIEIASSPLPTINDLGPPVIVSDFGNNNGLIIGPEVSNWQTSGFADWPVTLFIDGVEAGGGAANAFPDGPLGSVRFLLNHLSARGIAVPAGTWISSGAVTGVHPVAPGQSVEARFGANLTTNCMIAAV